ncbi:glycoside hydrolase family 127 protein [Pedobacter sp. WC2423]|uniref:glycoside hydrolase family 127 protein n=1 Tax=Pedobacter sp. WC2423 TaxID=3234142 RepID=UPI00346673AE
MMKLNNILTLLCLFSGTVYAQKKDYPIQPVAFTQVHVNDQFWAPKMEINAKVTIPHTLQQCKMDGRIDNFLRASKTIPGDKLTVFPFDDTDIYKVIEGASYAIQMKADPVMEKYVDTLISIIGAAQEKDGYLYTFRTVNAAKPHEWIGSKRWEKEEELSHELYNSGHLFESAAAHYQATGKKTLLNIALKNADLLVRDFGYGKTERYPGHQVVEIGLVRLYRITGNEQYLNLAKFFLDERGPKGNAYNQAQAKVVDQHEAVGHAVRAAYMYTGMADVAAITGDKRYLKAIDDIWEDVVNKKLYITGGIGSMGEGEAFGEAYHLPNMSAYAETCAAIANIYWNSRMFQLHGDSKYIDVLERTLYNGLLSGVSLSGDRFFYPNPLSSMHQHERSGWFSCACCISNMTRFLPSVPGYVYAQNENNLYVNLFMGNTSEIKLPVTQVKIAQVTAYPWDGKVAIKIDPEKNAAFTLHIRIPGWARNEAVPGTLYSFMETKPSPVMLTLNGKPFKYTVVKGYAVIDRTWKKGDQLVFAVPMETRKVFANEKVKDDKGRFAFQRGPVVYCLEGPDNKDSVVQDIIIAKNAEVTSHFNPDLLNGIEVLTVPGSGTHRKLNSNELIKVDQKVTAIPYYAWANRGASEMTVWVPYEESVSRPRPAASIASRSKVSGSLTHKQLLAAVKDQYEPADAKDKSYPYLHWWPKKGSNEFLQYDFDQEYEVSASKVYWFDDSPWGGCRIPDSYQLLYLSEGKWVPVEAVTGYLIEKDKFNVLRFKPVKTKALRLEVRLPKDNSSGIHEWVIE